MVKILATSPRPRDTHERSVLRDFRRQRRMPRRNHRHTLIEMAGVVRRQYAQYLRGDMSEPTEKMYTQLGGEYWFAYQHSKLILASQQTTLCRTTRLP